MTVSEFYTYTFVVFDEIAYEWVQGSYVAFEIKIFDEDQEVIVFTVEFSVRESQTCDPLLLGNEQIVFQTFLNQSLQFPELVLPLVLFRIDRKQVAKVLCLNGALHVKPGFCLQLLEKLLQNYLQLSLVQKLFQVLRLSLL
jgi:hypothetical protein